MDEINELKERIQFLEEKYKELVEEYIGTKCLCGKPVEMHLLSTNDAIRERLLNKIND